MKALRKGVSPVIATLLLILIAVAAAVLLYTWVSGLSANVAGSKVTGKTLTLIQATWARPLQNNTNEGDAAFSKSQAVLILSFQAPPAVAGGAGAGAPAVVFDVIDVTYSGRIVCHYDSFAMSADDKYHIGQKVGTATAAGMVFTGYSGSTDGNYDANDVLIPGGIMYKNSTEITYAANGTDTTTAGYLEITKMDAFATIVAGTWEVNYVSTNYVETYFRNTSAVIKYDRFVNRYANTTNVAATGDQVPLFDIASASQSNFAVVIWCPNVNPNVMQSVDVKLTFQDGSTWETNVPLSIQ